MTLALSVLEAEIATLIDPDDPNFAPHPTTQALAATNWATVYDNYVQDTSSFGASLAVDASGDAVASASKSAMETALAVMSSDASGFVSKLGTAVTAYWTGATFGTATLGCLATGTCACANVGGNGLFGVKTTSVVSVVVSTAFEAALSSFLGSDRSHAAAITAIASIFHTFTTTEVTVLISGLDTTMPTPLPITNTCTVF